MPKLQYLLIYHAHTILGFDGPFDTIDDAKANIDLDVYDEATNVTVIEVNTVYAAALGQG